MYNVQRAHSKIWSGSLKTFALVPYLIIRLLCVKKPNSQKNLRLGAIHTPSETSGTEAKKWRWNRRRRRKECSSAGERSTCLCSRELTKGLSHHFPISAVDGIGTSANFFRYSTCSHAIQWNTKIICIKWCFTLENSYPQFKLHRNFMYIGLKSSQEQKKRTGNKSNVIILSNRNGHGIYFDDKKFKKHEPVIDLIKFQFQVCLTK